MERKEEWNGRDDLANTDDGGEKKGVKEKFREIETDGHRADRATWVERLSG